MKSIRRHLTVVLLCGLLVLLAICGVVLYQTFRHDIVRQFDAALLADAHTVAAHVKLEDKGVEFNFPDEPDPKKARQRLWFEIWQSGKVLARSKSLGGNDIMLPREEQPRAFDVALPHGESGRAAAIWITPQPDEPEDRPAASQPSSRLLIVTARDREGLDETLTELLTTLLLGAAGMGLGTVAIVTLSVRRGLAPLRRMADQVVGIDARSLSHRFDDHHVPSELAPICNRLNDLLQRLEEAFARERRFTGDVSHELRTPLAELLALAEVALKWPGDAEAARQGFADVVSISRRMEATVTALLSLARGQAGRINIAVAPVDLAEMVRSSLGRRKRDDLQVQAQLDAVQFRSDPSLVASIVGNLVSNALDHAAHGGRVEVLLRPGEGGTAVLSIANSNDSLTQQDLPLLCQPFWQKDPSRTDPTHGGLGLALVSTYAGLIGAKLDARLDRPDWFVVSVTFPPFPPASSHS